MSVSDASTEIENTSEIQPYQTMRGHTNFVQGVAHLHDGHHIVTSSLDDSLRLWDRESGAQIGNDWRDGGDNPGVCNIALSPNGMTLASGGFDGTMRLWDVETKKVIAKWTGHTDWVHSVCWSAEGKRVASGSDNGTMEMWNVESQETDLGPIKTGHERVHAVAYSPDVSKIATGGLDEHAIKIWDTRTGELLSTLGQDSPACSLAWTSDQKKLIAGIGNGLIRIFDTVTWEQIAILEDHKLPVVAISLFRNDRLLASGSFDHAARLWNLDTNLPIGPPLRHRDWVHGVALSTDGKFLATACDDKNAYIWDIHAILNGAGLEDLLSIPDVSVSLVSSLPFRLLATEYC